MLDTGENPDAPQPKEMIDLEVHFWVLFSSTTLRIVLNIIKIYSIKFVPHTAVSQLENDTYIRRIKFLVYFSDPKAVFSTLRGSDGGLSRTDEISIGRLGTDPPPLAK